MRADRSFASCLSADEPALQHDGRWRGRAGARQRFDGTKRVSPGLVLSPGPAKVSVPCPSVRALAAAVAGFWLVTSACGGTVGGAARNESATTSAVSSTTVSGPRFYAEGAFTTRAADFVRQFNDQRLVLEGSGYQVDEMVGQQVDENLCGSDVSEQHAVYVLAGCSDDVVRGVLVTGDAAGDAGLHRRLVLLACGVVLPADMAGAASTSFLNRVLPELEDEADGLVVEFDPYYDVHVVVSDSRVGYLCVPPGAEAALVQIPST